MPARRRRNSSAVSTFTGGSAVVLAVLLSEEAQAVCWVILVAMMVSVAPLLKDDPGQRSLGRKEHCPGIVATLEVIVWRNRGS